MGFLLANADKTYEEKTIEQYKQLEVYMQEYKKEAQKKPSDKPKTKEELELEKLLKQLQDLNSNH